MVTLDAYTIADGPEELSFISKLEKNNHTRNSLVAYNHKSGYRETLNLNGFLGQCSAKTNLSSKEALHPIDPTGYAKCSLKSPCMEAFDKHQACFQRGIVALLVHQVTLKQTPRWQDGHSCDNRDHQRCFEAFFRLPECHVATGIVFIHILETRALKDIICRFSTSRNTTST